VAHRSNPGDDDPIVTSRPTDAAAHSEVDDEWLAGTSWRAAFDLPIERPSLHTPIADDAPSPPTTFCEAGSRTVEEDAEPVGPIVADRQDPLSSD
jgi:hypothetical protein